MNYLTRKIKAASQRGRERAEIRWSRDRERRAKLAEIALKTDWKIVRRIVVIDHESTAREIVFFAADQYSDRKRKLKEVRALAIP